MIRIFGFLVALSFCAASGASACVCDSDLFDNSARTVQEAYSDAAVVFRGVVKSVGPGLGKTDGPRASFDVTKVWKGPSDSDLSVSTLLEGCRFDFQVSEDYIVYALPDENGLFATSCTRTRQASQAQYDFEFLDQKASASVPRKIN
jgi:hypothetical protein